MDRTYNGKTGPDGQKIIINNSVGRDVETMCNFLPAIASLSVALTLPLAGNPMWRFINASGLISTAAVVSVVIHYLQGSFSVTARRFEHYISLKK